jgi:aconitate hydratase
VNMGVLPLEFRSGENAASLKISGREVFDVLGMGATLQPRGAVTVRVTRTDGTVEDVTATARIDTPEELVAFRHGGILRYVVRQLVKA